MKSRAFVLAAIVLLATGCSGIKEGAAPQASLSTKDFNATDVMFAQMMVAHSAPAVEILKVAQARTKNEQIRMLAAAVDVTQADEVTSMLAWLKDWQQPTTPDAKPETHAAHGGLPTMGQTEIAALKNASDADFDRTFLNLFIGHQRQAVEYARMEAASGANAKAVDLARRVDLSRRAQIEMMVKMVGSGG